jgi:acetyl esterase/lipase
METGPFRIFTCAFLLGNALLQNASGSGAEAPAGPMKTPVSTPSIPPGIEFIESLPYGKAGDIPLILELAKPRAASRQPRPAVVFIHGGAWASADKTNGRPLILMLAQKGFVAVSIDYRLSGVAGFPAQLEDSKCAVRFLRAHADVYGLDPARIGAMGGSAGGHLAALVGLTGDEKELEGTGGWETFSSKVSAVADLYGISDLPQLVQANKLRPSIEKLMRGKLDAKPELYRQASPLSWVKAGSPPFYLAHGDKDETVPYDQSVRLAEALRAAGSEATLRPMPGMGHGSIGTLPSYVLEDIAAFFIKTLGPVEPAE